jgi:UDP-glucuronate decarboxylase
MTKKILVTGGAGFLGSHICRTLLGQGHHVIALDNFYTGNRRNLDGILDHPDFKLIEASVLNPIDLAVDEIYNMACPASPPHYQRDPVYTWKTSVLGALNVLELAQRTQAKVLQASTSEVYGDPAVHPQPESYWGNVNPIGIRSCYDEGKRAAETLFMDYRRMHGTDTRLIRIFNTYGPQMDPNDGRVVSNFICQALRGDEITIYGDGLQTRSFCYVDDLVAGIIACMNSDQTDGQPVNLGNPVEFTMRELAEKVLSKIETTSRIVYQPLPSDDPKQRQPDISCAKAVLNWAPQVDLSNGLDRTIPWFKSLVT